LTKQNRETYNATKSDSLNQNMYVELRTAVLLLWRWRRRRWLWWWWWSSYYIIDDYYDCQNNSIVTIICYHIGRQCLFFITGCM